MPPNAGDFEIRYVLNQGKTALASTPIKIEAAEVTLDAPDTATPGALVSIEWVGPDAQGDYISVSESDADDGTYISYKRTFKRLKNLEPK